MVGIIVSAGMRVRKNQMTVHMQVSKGLQQDEEEMTQRQGASLLGTAESAVEPEDEDWDKCDLYETLCSRAMLYFGLCLTTTFAPWCAFLHVDI